MKVYVFSNLKDKSKEAYAKFKPLLEEYNLEAITGGTDALADVFVITSDSEGNKSTGKSTNQDIVMASILAVLDSINKF